MNESLSTPTRHLYLNCFYTFSSIYSLPQNTPSPVYRPSPSTPSSLTEKNAPSPIKTPSSKNNADNNIKIIDDSINPSVKTPSSSLRGLNRTKGNMNEAKKTDNNEDIATTKEVNIGVIVTISVLSTLLVIMIIGGLDL